MPRIAIYDPPGCCSTGVCDPGLSESMAQFASAIERLIKQGVDVERYNLGSQPGAFAENPVIKGALDSDGMDCLPLVIIDGAIARKGGYMTRTELGEKLGLAVPETAPAGAAGGCCGGD